MPDRVSGRPSAAISIAPYSPPSQTAEEPLSARVNVANTTPPSSAAWWHSQFNLMLLMFGLMALIALLAVRLSPPPEVSLAKQSGVNTAAISTPKSSAPSPWNESQQQQARIDSQAVLQQLLSAKIDLQSKQVDSWGSSLFEQALSTAKEGDINYNQGEFSTAIEQYQQALQGMQSLLDSVPSYAAEQIQLGLAAIDAGEPVAAIGRFEFALVLDPANQSGIDGLQRAEQLAPLLNTLGEAQNYQASYQQNNDVAVLQSAAKLYQDILQIDPALAAAAAGLSRVEAEIAERRFKAAMSKGYRALFAGQFVTARRAFGDAMQHKPNDPAAAQALQQSKASGRSASLNEMLEAAKLAETAEDWPRALANYQAVLGRDKSQITAKIGKIKSLARNALDKQIVAILADPLALSIAEKAQLADKVLADAKAIKNPGARLRAQISAMQSGIQQSDLPLKVQFVSNSQTQVYLLKVGAKKLDMGVFSSKNLILKAGRYVATGRRNGYHDVRIEIELSAQRDDNNLTTYVVSCEQSLAAAVSVAD